MSTDAETVLPKRFGLRTLPVVVRKQVVASQDRLPCPIEIKEAVKAIRACSDLLDLKQWGDKSDALAAWAKIYNDDKISMEARRLKIRVFAQASKVAEKLRPHKTLGNNGAGLLSGSVKGARSALMDAGWKTHSASQARAVGAIPGNELEEMIARDRPPTVYQIEARYSGKRYAGGRSDCHKIVWVNSSRSNLFSALCFVRKYRGQAAEMARIYGSEATKARANVLEIQEWLDEYEQHLPKA